MRSVCGVFFEKRFDLKLDFSKSDSILFISVLHVQNVILGQENLFRSH